MLYTSHLIFTIILSLFTGISNEKTPEKPNILFILVDDLGCDDMGFSGSKYYETPHTDSLAKKGTIFTRGYSASSVCSPSRASILTGTWPTVHGITDYLYAKTGEAWSKTGRHTKLLPPPYQLSIDANLTTIAQVLHHNGYKTVMAGKWHLGKESENASPTDKGFDVNIGGSESGGPYSGGYFSPFNNEKLIDRPQEQGMSYAMKLVKELGLFIEQNKNTPFFAYLSFYEVHAPIQTSESKWKKYRDKSDQQGIHDVGFDTSHFFPTRKYQDNPVYAGLIEQMDDAVGVILQKLKELKLDKNTIVVFTGDNGGVNSGDDYSTAPLHYRGGKGMQWEGGTRVPLVVYVPWLKQVPTSDTPVSGIDFFPTLLHLTLNDRYHIRQKLNGTNISPLLKGQAIKDRALYWHYPHYSNQGSQPASYVVKDNWKLIYYYEDKHEELYNLDTDPFENNNVAQTNTKERVRLRKILFNWLNETCASSPVPDKNYIPEALAQWKQEINTKQLKKLEAHRKEILKIKWKPNENWWKSKVISNDN
ncbi:sulfatase [Emticicia sp. BO119]|uniref:sulfatase n=1 Tax=Emticicia sp. BO119 TaxID=2757768 RepID=UPI0015F0389D|nr:sulfatase [Emticicia sp. BO119]MBA4850209.1 sulfatase [Emticicia sp. BO119]